MSIIGVTFATILLPTLSKLYKSHEVKKARQTQEHAIKIGFFLTMPCTAALIVLAEPMISLIYEYGAFTKTDTMNTSHAIAAFSLGLPAFVLSKIFMPIFYAHHDTKTPMKITIQMIVSNIILNLILMQSYGFVGIALGSSIASWIGVYFSIRYTKRFDYFHLTGDLIMFICKLIFCAMIASIVMFCSYLYMSEIFMDDGVFDRAMIVFSSLGIGFAIYIILSLLAGVVSMERLKL
jgi:putative peptidoglycan lipid II flippase